MRHLRDIESLTDENGGAEVRIERRGRILALRAVFALAPSPGEPPSLRIVTPHLIAEPQPAPVLHRLAPIVSIDRHKTKTAAYYTLSLDSGAAVAINWTPSRASRAIYEQFAQQLADAGYTRESWLRASGLK